MRFSLSCHKGASDEDLLLYAQSVGFIAYWCEKNDGAHGKNAQEIFEEFRDNVTSTMKLTALEGDYSGSGNTGLRSDKP